ncbi:MAG: OmpA family protein, partial [Spirulinaceae cyanobacterium RM2_2_10]|nr:OmpA family protein [Spirulinaceae cyanobacterium RM2_2_10]
MSSNQQARAQALSEGKVDLMVTTLDQYLVYQPAGRIVALVDRTVGADAVLLNTQTYPQLQSLLDLETLVAAEQAQGRRLKIVYAGDTPSEFLAIVLDTKFDNFNLADFEIEKVADASIAWERMQSDRQVAIAVLWEPFVTEAQQQGNTVVLSSADAPRSIVDVAVASDRLLASNPEAVKSFVETYYRRIDASLQDRELLTRQIAQDGDLDPEAAQAVSAGIQFFTSVEAQDWMQSGTLDKRIGAIASILVLAGRLPAPPADPQALYTAEYLTAVAQQTAGLVELIAQDNPELAERLRPAANTAQAANASPEQVQQAPDIGNLTVQGEVQFQTGSAQLTTTGVQTLDRLAAEISEFSPANVGIKVQGHTSRTGSADLNQRLSQQRAQVVVDYLKNKQLQHSFFPEGLRAFRNRLI